MGEAGIRIAYSIDYDISTLHQRVIKILSDSRNRRIEALKLEQESLKNQIRRSKPLNQKKIELQRILAVNKEISELESDFKSQGYISESQPLLEGYQRLGCIIKKAVFGSSEVSYLQESPEKSLERSKILSDYFEIVMKYLPKSNIVKKRGSAMLCKNCNVDLNEHLDLSEPGSKFTCPLCNIENNIFVQFIGIQDIPTSDYEDRENFIKAIDQFQGEQKVRLPESLFSDLDAYFSSIGIPSGEEIRRMSHEDKNRLDLGKKLLRKAMRKKGYVNMYDHINKIIHEYWGWELPSISHLRDLIISDYDKTSSVFKRIKGVKRKANINRQWRLKHHLILRGYPVHIDDFKMLHTPEILEYYKSVWGEMIRSCGDVELINLAHKNHAL